MVKLFIRRQIFRVSPESYYQSLHDLAEADEQWTDAKAQIEFQFTSEDSFSGDTLIESSDGGTSEHSNVSSCLIDEGLSTSGENEQNAFSTDDYSLDDNFGESVLTVWSVEPGIDCADPAIFLDAAADSTTMPTSMELTSHELNNLKQSRTTADKLVAVSENDNALDTQLHVGYRIALELDTLTYPTDTREVKDTKTSTMDNACETKMIQRKLDPLAKFTYPVDVKDKKTKPRGRDPSIIQLSDDTNGDNEDVPLYYYNDTGNNSLYISRSQCLLQRKNSRPDPPACLMSPQGRISSQPRSHGKATSGSCLEVPLQHNYEASFISKSEETIHLPNDSSVLTSEQYWSFPLDAFLCPSSSYQGKHRGGLFTWLHRRRVTV